MLDGLPVLFVDSYDDVTEELLDDAWQRLSTQVFNYSRLTTDVWAAQIRATAARHT
jgi:hypothetical protein